MSITFPFHLSSTIVPTSLSPFLGKYSVHIWNSVGVYVHKRKDSSLKSVCIRKVLRPVTRSRFSVIFLSLRENIEFLPKTHVAIHQNVNVNILTLCNAPNTKSKLHCNAALRTLRSKFRTYTIKPLLSFFPLLIAKSHFFTL
jgi:hypothetical protein